MPAQTRRLLVLTAALALFAAPAARAQEPASPDPTRGSPSGTIYEIPVDGGRHDAAPRSGRHGGGPSAPSSGAQSPTPQGDSPIHSDNGFGTSSVVPGATPDGQAQRPKTSKRSKTSKRRSRESSRVKPSSESQIPEGQQRVTAAVGNSPSLRRSYLLLALGVVLGIVLAVGARLASRQR